MAVRGVDSGIELPTDNSPITARLSLHAVIATLGKEALAKTGLDFFDDVAVDTVIYRRITLPHAVIT
jgi:hypothetical protein